MASERAPTPSSPHTHRRLLREVPGSHEYCGALLGKMRCLASLAEWDVLSALCKVEWGKSEPHMR